MSVVLIELVEMTATLNVVVSINSTTVMQTYWTASTNYFLLVCFCRLVDTSTYTLSSSEPFSYNLEIVTFLNFCIS